MHTVTIDEAKSHLPELFEAASSGEDVFITNNDGSSVQLVPRQTKKRKRQFGSAKGMISMAPDFDEPLEDFKEYM
jgi:antitoxin (DNA-binding transcriptional repressor) of toxin-antitoxin stability system